MKGKLAKVSSIIVIVAIVVTMLFVPDLQARADDAAWIPVYRLYNAENGEHLYTTDYNEVMVLYSNHGWGYEGIGWYTTSTGTPVYRLYNPVLGNHLYTTDTNEVNVLTTTTEWVKDNNGNPVFYSGGSTPIYRLYNRELQGMHHLTTDRNEYDTLPTYGWTQEGESIMAISLGEPIPTHNREDVNGTCAHEYYNNYCETPKVCKYCGYVDFRYTKHTMVMAGCTTPRTCLVCGKTEGEPTGHNYEWVLTRDELTGNDAYSYMCTNCGDVQEVVIDYGKETDWVYSNGGKHREKTMYDGTVIKEDLVTYKGISMWGWFDDASASAMTEAVHKRVAEVSGWRNFNISEACKEKAKLSAWSYAGRVCMHDNYVNSDLYYGFYGGLPDVEKQKTSMKINDGWGVDNYIGCFVHDAYQDNDNYVYGKYWRNLFGTFYSSAK